MGKNRDRLSIIADILESTGNGANKTRIMFKANLSYKLLEKYLNKVVNLGFVQEDDYKYVLTEQGKDFLINHKQFNERYLNAQKLLESLDIERKKLESMCEAQN